MPSPLSLTLLTLGVADVARAAAFYEAFGLTRAADSNDHVAFFNTTGSILALYGREALAEDAELTAAGEGFRGVAMAWNLRSDEEVDKAVVRWVAAGGRLTRAARKTFWGGYSAYVSDPDGHLWEIAHAPGFFWDAAGRMTAQE
ncbi:VOC family protein [Methylopila musalis]|uniref:VOC family protein n=1 Tax=Methylopila musalis TaxID=1134781 RepID=A0ABW3ZB73_9HYPH